MREEMPVQYDNYSGGRVYRVLCNPYPNGLEMLIPASEGKPSYVSKTLLDNLPEPKNFEKCQPKLEE